MPSDKIVPGAFAAPPGGTKGLGPTLQRAAVVSAWCVAALLNIWCVAALYFDLPFPRVRLPGAVVYALFVPASIFFARRVGWRLAICLGSFAIVLLWWLSLKPSNDRNWQADVAQTPWAEVSGDVVTIHNYRDCRYQTESEYICESKIKTVRLSELRGIDVAFIHWGIPKIAHIIVSFHFAGDDYVAASVEMRKQVGQSYSAIRGFFRRYTLIYVFADEHDLIRLRSNFRKGEEVDLYRTTADAEYSRQLFLQYLQRANELHERPEWYNALTSNCTTNIFSEMRAIGPLPAGISSFDPRVVFSGEADKMLYDRGLLAGNLPFAQLREQSRINPIAQVAGNSPDFSRVIRAGRAGFESQSMAHPPR